MNDGAAALLLMSGEKAIQLGLKPLARILAYADAEQAPEWFTTTPSIALPKAVAKAGLRMEDIAYWELNEAFAVVGIENTRRMKRWIPPVSMCMAAPSRWAIRWDAAAQGSSFRLFIFCGRTRRVTERPGSVTGGEAPRP